MNKDKPKDEPVITPEMQKIIDDYMPIVSKNIEADTIIRNVFGFCVSDFEIKEDEYEDEDEDENNTRTET